VHYEGVANFTDTDCSEKNGTNREIKTQALGIVVPY
jgi:hypothetical protein